MRYMLSPAAAVGEDRLLQLFLSGDSAEPASGAGFPCDLLGRGQLVPDAWLEGAGRRGVAVRQTAPEAPFRLAREVPGPELPEHSGPAVEHHGYGPELFAYGPSPPWLLLHCARARLPLRVPDVSPDALFDA